LFLTAPPANITHLSPVPALTFGDRPFLLPLFVGLDLLAGLLVVLISRRLGRTAQKTDSTAD
jgi:hypothetical protein